MALPAAPETGWKHPRRFHGMTDSAAADRAETVCLDFAEPQQAGLAATAHVAEAGLPRGRFPRPRRVYRSSNSRPPDPERDTGTAPADQGRADTLRGPGTRPRPGRPAASTGPDRHTDRSGDPLPAAGVEQYGLYR